MSQENPQDLQIHGKRYRVSDQLENIPVVDSFVKVNKIGSGNGEARLYLGSQINNRFGDFFDSYPAPCFFLREDLYEYLKDSRFEYKEQEQNYRSDISANWQEYHNELNSFPEVIRFETESANGSEDTSRYYIRSNDTQDVFHDYFRRIALPVISYLSILKLVDEDGKTEFLFKPFLDYYFNPLHHPAKIQQVKKAVEQSTTLSERKKEQIVQARVGQGKYRQGLLELMSECLVTRVNDERMLIASHIKPWSVSTDDEKIDPHNGLALTPTYDRLFDQGFITFEEDGRMRVSPYISPLNVRKLGIIPNKAYKLPDSIKLKNYLVFHRDNIFKG